MTRGLSLVWHASRYWTIAWALILILQGIVPAALVYLTKIAVDHLTSALTKQDILGAVLSSWLPIALIGFLWIFSQVLASLMSWVRAIQSELAYDHIKALVHYQTLRLDVAFYDNPDSYDLLYQSSVEAIERPIALLESLGSLVQNGLTLFVLALFLISYAYWLPLLLVFSAFPGLWALGSFMLREYQWRMRNTINERRINYYDMMLTQRESAAEIHLFNLGRHFQEAFKKLRAEIRAGRLALVKDKLKTEMKAGLITWSGALIGMGYMLFLATRKLVTIGDLVLCYQAFQRGQGLLQSILESTAQIYRSMLYIDNLFRFLELEPQIISALNPRLFPSSIKEGVSFEKVAFCYPGSERKALVNLSFTMKAGQVTAIVGHNGSGKSTLVKLLCRFYDPQHGNIRLDGIDIKELNIESLRRQITVLFQEPIHYQMTAGENISLGLLEKAADMGRIVKTAQAVGADHVVRQLPQDYNTVLGKWFGGAELSVGEWQRLSLARAFFRDTSIIVLDEPTSNMDSWAEGEWLKRFREITAGHTALIITHRFTTAMHADIIHVMTKGQIIESGTHTELIKLNRHYAESWRSQVV